MKFVVLIAILAVLFFVLGARRGQPREPEARTPPPPPPGPKPMLRCAECGMHLPADEALPGKGGVFCSASHRATFEARSS